VYPSVNLYLILKVSQSKASSSLIGGSIVASFPFLPRLSSAKRWLEKIIPLKIETIELKMQDHTA